MDLNYDIVTPEWIKANMKSYGLSGKNVAQAMNTTQTSVSRWVNEGKIAPMAKAGLYWLFKNIRISQGSKDTQCPRCHYTEDIRVKPVCYDCMECGYTWLEPSDINVLKG
jgi:ribosomal protein L37AE/L43A